jgi:hypothetical protein
MLVVFVSLFDAPLPDSCRLLANRLQRADKEASNPPAAHLVQQEKSGKTRPDASLLLALGTAQSSILAAGVMLKMQMPRPHNQ